MKNPKEAKKYLDMCVQMGGIVPEEISLQVQSAILSEEHPKLPPKLYIVGNLHNPK